MDFNDLRSFIEALDERGEVRVIKGADWNLEIGAIAEITAQKLGRPALLFDQIKGYPQGFRVLSNAFGSLKRTALALNIPEALPLEMLKAWRQRLKEVKPIPPVSSKEAPVLQNTLTGEKVDLFRFPAPLWHEADGGRYIGTGDAVVLRDPDEGWVNVGTYRISLVDRNTATIVLGPGKHGRTIMERYHSRGESCPVAVALGEEPLLWALASSSLAPWGMSEYAFAGGLKGKPVGIIPGPITGLPIPATAEIVLEGEIPPLEEASAQEGPFGEWIGYYSPSPKSANIIRVKAIYYRDTPIILGAPPLKPPAHFHFAIPILAASVWDQLEAAWVRGIKGVWFLVIDWGPMVMVVSLEQRYAGHAKQVALAATGCESGAYGGKITIVVDDDIDITSAEEVLWAVASRCNVDNVDIVQGVWTSVADPSVPPEAGGGGRHPVSSRLLIDACRPFPRLKEYPRVNAFEPGYLREVARKWGLEG